MPRDTDQNLKDTAKLDCQTEFCYDEFQAKHVDYFRS